MTRNSQFAPRPSSTCPICGQPLTGRTKNAIYTHHGIIPVSAPVHDPVCFEKVYPAGHQPIPVQPSLFADIMN